MPDVTTAVAMTTCAAATTANDGSAGGGHWHGNPNAGPGSSSGAWHNTGGHGEYIGTETFEIPFMQVVVQASESGHYDGEILFRTESGDGFILPAEFADCPLPEWVDPADYTVLRMDYYGCFSDAAMTDAEYVNGSLTPSFCVLERGNTLRRFSVLFWFPNEVWVDADFCKEQISADWDAAHFYSTLPAFGDSFMISVDFYE